MLSVCCKTRLLIVFFAGGSGMGFTLCFDNVNWKTCKNYQFRDHLNNRMNMVQSLLPWTGLQHQILHLLYQDQKMYKRFLRKRSIQPRLTKRLSRTR